MLAAKLFRALIVARDFYLRIISFLFLVVPILAGLKAFVLAAVSFSILLFSFVIVYKGEIVQRMAVRRFVTIVEKAGLTDELARILIARPQEVGPWIEKHFSGWSFISTYLFKFM